MSEKTTKTSEFVGFGEAFANFFKKYVIFSGKASRSEYWFAFLGITVISAVLNLISWHVHWFGWIALVWALVITVPLIAAGVRRLHDAGYSAPYAIPTGVLLALGSIIAVIGTLWHFKHGFIGGVLLIIGIAAWAIGLISSCLYYNKPSVANAKIDDEKAIEELKKNPEAVLKGMADETVQGAEKMAQDAAAEAKATADKAAKAGESAVNAAKESFNKK